MGKIKDLEVCTEGEAKFKGPDGKFYRIKDPGKRGSRRNGSRK